MPRINRTKRARTVDRLPYIPRPLRLLPLVPRLLKMLLQFADSIFSNTVVGTAANLGYCHFCSPHRKQGIKCQFGLSKSFPFGGDAAREFLYVMRR